MSNASPPETSKFRLGLRAFAVLLAVVIMSILGATWHNEPWLDYIIVGVPGIWSLVNVILIALKRPVHPGAHIALDLIFTILQWLFGITGLTFGTVNGDSGRSRRNNTIAALSLMVFNGILHFVHFVLGCCDVHWRRHASSGNYNTQKGDIQNSA